MAFVCFVSKAAGLLRSPSGPVPPSKHDLCVVAGNSGCWEIERVSIESRGKEAAMSWQAYVDDHLMCHISGGHTLTAAAIIGQDGQVWAQSESFPEVRRFLFIYPSWPCFDKLVVLTVYAKRVLVVIIRQRTQSDVCIMSTWIWRFLVSILVVCRDPPIWKRWTWSRFHDCAVVFSENLRIGDLCKVVRVGVMVSSFARCSLLIWSRVCMILKWSEVLLFMFAGNSDRDCKHCWRLWGEQHSPTARAVSRRCQIYGDPGRSGCCDTRKEGNVSFGF